MSLPAPARIDRRSRPRGAAAAALVAGLSAGTAIAGDLTWPGAGACGGTLQACLDSAAAGDRIRIGSDGPIDQDLSIPRSLRIEVLPGFAPRLLPGRRITANPGGAADFALRLRGFVLESGSIDIVRSGSGALQLSLQDLDIVAAPGRSAVSVATSGSGAASVVVVNVELAIDGADGTDARPAVRLVHAASGLLDGVIGFARIDARGLGGAPVLRLDLGASGAAMDVFGVRADGSGWDSGVHASASGGVVALNIVGCVFGGQRDAGGAGAALRVDAGASTATVNLLQNTLVGNQRAVALTGSALGGAAQNNLVAFNAVRGLVLPPGTLGNRDNLVFGNGQDDFIAGPGTLAIDPRLIDPMLPRLRADSPAVDAGDRTLLDAVLAARALPALDVDGLRRFKGAGAAVDLGAFESGDALHSEIAGGANLVGDALVLTAPGLDGQPAAAPQLGVRRTDGVPSAAVALRYTGATGGGLSPQRWAVQSAGAGGPALPLGAAFDLFLPDRGGAGVATIPASSVAGPVATLDYAPINGDPIAFVLATHHRNGSGSDLPNGHPVGLAYDDASSRWQVRNLDGAAMPAGIVFTVYAQPESGSAVLHEAAANTLVGSATVLHHPQLDGNACARPIAQPVATEGIAPVVPVATRYDTASARWRIETFDGSPMPAGAAFHVLVLPGQAETCAGAVFADGFE